MYCWALLNFGRHHVMYVHVLVPNLQKQQRWRISSRNTSIYIGEKHPNHPTGKVSHFWAIRVLQLPEFLHHPLLRAFWLCARGLFWAPRDGTIPYRSVFIYITTRSHSHLHAFIISSYLLHTPTPNPSRYEPSFTKYTRTKYPRTKYPRTNAQFCHPLPLERASF